MPSFAVGGGRIRAWEGRGSGIEMVRAEGIEPSQPAWKAGVLPLNYARGDR